MHEIIKILIESWQIMTEMSIYLLFGFAMAGVLHLLIPQKLIETHLSGYGILKCIKAALIGVPIPLCSCSVIPVTASLRKHGAGPGATVSFLTSTPQTGVDSIIITYGMLGWIFAVFRVITALISGILCGAAVEIFDSSNTNLNNRDIPNDLGRTSKNRLHEFFHYAFVVLPGDIAKSLMVGIVIAGVLGALIPQNFFVGYINNTFLSMIVMMLVGLPLYVCATASVPIAVAFLQMGLSPGAVLVFLITGPATNAATITTIAKILSKKTAIIYLATITISAFVAGFFLNMFGTIETTMMVHHHTKIFPEWLKNGAAILMFLILLNAFIPKKKKQNKAVCEHCKDE